MADNINPTPEFLALRAAGQLPVSRLGKSVQTSFYNFKNLECVHFDGMKQQKNGMKFVFFWDKCL